MFNSVNGISLIHVGDCLKNCGENRGALGSYTLYTLVSCSVVLDLFSVKLNVSGISIVIKNLWVNGFIDSVHSLS